MKDLPEGLHFGKINKEESDMKNILSSKYSGNEKAVDAINNAAKRKFVPATKPPKPTNTAVLRGQVTEAQKKEYNIENRSHTSNLSREC